MAMSDTLLPKTTRNTSVVEKAGFIARCNDRDMGTMGDLVTGCRKDFL